MKENSKAHKVWSVVLGVVMLMMMAVHLQSFSLRVLLEVAKLLLMLMFVRHCRHM